MVGAREEKAEGSTNDWQRLWMSERQWISDAHEKKLKEMTLMGGKDGNGLSGKWALECISLYLNHTPHERWNAGSRARAHANRKKQQMNILIDQMRDTNITLSELATSLIPLSSSTLTLALALWPMSCQFKSASRQNANLLNGSEGKQKKNGNMSKETTSQHIRILSQSVFCRGITTHRHFFRFAIYRSYPGRFAALRAPFQSIWLRISVYVDNYQPIYLRNWLLCTRHRFGCEMSKDANGARSLKAEEILSI